MKFMVRFFVSNPGGAYDPAPLHEFEYDVGQNVCDIPLVGDKVQWDSESPCYEVVERLFDFSSTTCMIYVRGAPRPRKAAEVL